MNKNCENISCGHYDVCRQYESALCVSIMDVINPQFSGENLLTKKRFVIVGTPARVIKNNLISYRVPVRLFVNGDFAENITHITVPEDDMYNMLEMAREMFSDEEANKAYA